MAYPEIAPSRDRRIIRGVLVALDSNIARAGMPEPRRGSTVTVVEQARLQAVAHLALTARHAITTAIESMSLASPREQRIGAINGVAALAAEQAAVADMSLTIALGENVTGMRQNVLSPMERERAEETAYLFSDRADEYTRVAAALGYTEIRAEPGGAELLEYAPGEMQVVASIAS